MITEEDTASLLAQAAAGRGLWIGAFLPTYPRDVWNQRKHPLRYWMPDDAHVTLVHLGKKVTDQTVLMAVNATHRTQKKHFGPDGINLELTGVGWFWRRDYKNPRQSSSQTPVALVNSAKLCDVRYTLIEELRALGCHYSDRYGFVPHVTLNNGPIADLPLTVAETSTMVTAPPLDVPCYTVTVVCGDVRVNVL